MIRRGFTLIEMMLAMVVGMLVLATALSVMLAVTRTDRDLSDRAEQQHEIARTRIAVNRALTNLRPARNNIVREILTGNSATDDDVTSFLAETYADPIDGAPHRFQLDTSTGKAELVLRVRKGEQFDVITTLAQNFVRKRPDARANYRLVVQEVSP